MATTKRATAETAVTANSERLYAVSTMANASETRCRRVFLAADDEDALNYGRSLLDWGYESPIVTQGDRIVGCL